MIMRLEGGICYTHGPFTSGLQCPFFPNCNDPQQRFIEMGNAQVYKHNKVHSQAELNEAVADFRTAVLTLVRKKAEEWATKSQLYFEPGPAAYWDSHARAARQLEKEIGELK